MSSKQKAIAYWVVTILFCLQMGFTAYAGLALPQVAEAFAFLGFPDYFRVQLSIAKFIGIALLVTPVPARAKEWAYAGFAFDLGSAVIAHNVKDEPFEVWVWALGTLVLGAVSYVLWRVKSARPMADSR